MLFDKSLQLFASLNKYFPSLVFYKSIMLSYNHWSIGAFYESISQTSLGEARFDISTDFDHRSLKESEVIKCTVDILDVTFASEDYKQFRAHK